MRTKPEENTMTAQIHVDLADGILTMTLARPDKKNALTNEMYGRLADVIEHAEHDGQTRVLLVQADGDMFTAGNDVGEFAAIASGKGPSERHVHRFRCPTSGKRRKEHSQRRGR